MKVIVNLFLAVLISSIIVSCAAVKTQEQIELENRINSITQPDGPVYLAHNLWYEHQQFIEAINFKSLPGKIPIGTEVMNVQINNPSPQKNIFTQYISFYLKDDDTPYHLVFINKYQRNEDEVLTIQDLLLRTFTPQTFEELTEGLKEMEIECIRRGVIMIGMSKKAVLLSWGYPPLHKTPSLDAVLWTYWKMRVSKIEVSFDENDCVIESSWYGKGGNYRDVIE